MSLDLKPHWSDFMNVQCFHKWRSSVLTHGLCDKNDQGACEKGDGQSLALPRIMATNASVSLPP